ncbi:hypothetical protein HN415_00840 [Candidatus Woesearchaeota archaeon]|jgi:hypothetical protein|nr:hypothetical protein [Candidatus Woesearchaeota archaeon]
MDKKLCKFDADIINSESNKTLVSGFNTVVGDILSIGNATDVTFNYEVLYLEDILEHSVEIVGDCNTTANVTVSLTLNNGTVVLNDTSIALDSIPNHLHVLHFTSPYVVNKGMLSIKMEPNNASSLMQLKEIFVNRVTHSTNFSPDGPLLTLSKELNNESAMIKFVDQSNATSGGFLFDISMFNTVSVANVGDRMLAREFDKDIYEDSTTIFAHVKVPSTVGTISTAGEDYYIPMHKIKYSP